MIDILFMPIFIKSFMLIVNSLSELWGSVIVTVFSSALMIEKACPVDTFEVKSSLSGCIELAVYSPGGNAKFKTVVSGLLINC